ncbi:type IV fimbrial assembly protein PilB [Planctomycetota bacterium]|nr:type IV fimbrial assembly protein PilB [Planctomycetota bacterium]
MPTFHQVDPKALLKLLYEWEEVGKDAAQQIWAAHKKQGKDIAEACKAGGIRPEAFLAAVAKLLGLEVVVLQGMTLPKALIELVPPAFATSYRIVPVRLDDKTLVIATADPDAVFGALDDLKFELRSKGIHNVRAALADHDQVEAAVEQYYANDRQAAGQELMQQAMSDMRETADADVTGEGAFQIDIGLLEGLDQSNVGAMAESAPVRKLLNLIMLTAVKAQASDIHFEPFENEFRVRNRIDGVLYEMLPVPVGLAAALVARIKVMSHLDISERRLPQDGKIPIKIGDREVDLRVSTLPTMFGESVVIRILDRSVVNLDIDKLGFPDDSLAYFKDKIGEPNGVIIVTGPTGSGKTTTLYAALSSVNTEDTKIITTEDPVEYEIAGLVQVPVDDEIDKTFANCLRSILRQDPDIILVGEVRDFETAQIAIQASLTGHLVFTTLHTNDAPTAITRLVDMGVEPFLLAATVETICAQRLVRTICVKCKAPYEPTDEELLTLGIKKRDFANQRFYYGKGCDHCKRTGYKGRTALFEMMDINDNVRELVIKKASANQIRNAAQKGGMRTLRDAGIQKVLAGLTSIEEVIRETLAAEE